MEKHQVIAKVTHPKMIREFELFSHWGFESFAPGSIPRAKYNAFQRIHQVSGPCFHLLASMEALVMEQMVVDWSRVNNITHELVTAIRILVDQLQAIHPVEFMDAQEWFAKISFYTRLATDCLALEATPPFIHAFAGHNAQPKEHKWLPRCLGAPDALQAIITTPALFQYFIEASDLRKALDTVLQQLDITDFVSMQECESEIRTLLATGFLPQVVVNDLEIAVFDLTGSGGKIDVWTFVGEPRHWQPVAVQQDIEPTDIAAVWKNAVSAKYSPLVLRRRLIQALADEEEGVLVCALPTKTSEPACVIPQKTDTKVNFQKFQHRLQQVLPLVTDLHVFQAEGELLLPEHCRSLHDLVCLCLEQGLAGIFSLAGEPSRGLAGIKQIHLEVPVVINSFNLGGGLFPSAAEKTIVSMDDVRSVPAWSFLQGLVSPALCWPGQRSEEEISPPHYSSYAIVDLSFVHCTLRLGRNLYAVECSCADSQEKYVHFRFKGSGHLSKNLTRRDILAQILEEDGFTIDVCGDYIDAVRFQDMDVYLQRNLICLGLLVAWTHVTPLDVMANMGKNKGVQSFRDLQEKALLPSL